MRKIILIAFTFVMISICSAAASAQVTRIHFAPGATSKVVTGTLHSYKSHRKFVIRVRAGQTLTTEDVGKHPITLAIKGPPGSNYEQDMAADCHSHNEITPTAAGDYKITVTECQKADPWRGTFKMRIKVN